MTDLIVMGGGTPINLEAVSSAVNEEYPR